MAVDTKTETAAEESARLTAHAESERIPKEALDGAVHDYPADLNYWMIALLLGAITAVEVSTYTHPDLWESVLVPALLIMMAIKFFAVIFYFMHLKFDNRLFGLLFYMGLFLAIGVYCAALLTFHFFNP